MLTIPAFEGFPISLYGAPLAPIPLGGLALWFDATRGIGLDGASTRVTSWTPRGGASGIASQATTAQMPVLSTLNGLAAVAVDGADDALTLATGSSIGDTLTFFVAGQVSSLSVLRTVLSGANGAPQYYVLNTGAQRLNVQGVGTIAIGTASKVVAGATFQMNATFDRNGGTNGPYALRFNRAADASGVASVAAFSQPISSLGNLSGTGVYAGLLGEIVAYSRVLSGAEIANVEAYLAAKWGTP